MVVNGRVLKKKVKGNHSFQLVHTDDLSSYFLPLELSNDIQTKNGLKY